MASSRTSLIQSQDKPPQCSARQRSNTDGFVDAARTIARRVRRNTYREVPMDNLFEPCIGCSTPDSCADLGCWHEHGGDDEDGEDTPVTCGDIHHGGRK